MTAQAANDKNHDLIMKNKKTTSDCDTFNMEYPAYFAFPNENKKIKN